MHVQRAALLDACLRMREHMDSNYYGANVPVLKQVLDDAIALTARVGNVRAELQREKGTGK